jgi:lysine 6-dehydrogenase
MKRIVVLGSGLVGGLIASDLAADPELAVTAVDASQKALDALPSMANLDRRQADLSEPSAIREVIGDADCVVGAVPGRFGYMMLETVIRERKPVADISFGPEDTLTLDGLARENGVTAVVDCGVSPGLSNLAVGRAAHLLGEVDEAVIYVGGLPAERYWPYEYRAVFSPTDVIEEYTRPARLVEEHRVVVRDALSEIEPVDFPGVGTLEAFNTDGLRTLISTIRGRNMREKTLRWPGHAEKMRMLRETGFFGGEPVDVDGTAVVPRRLAEKLIFAMWQRPPGEEEITVLRVDVRGKGSDGAVRAHRFDLFDRTDRVTGATSMARTTGFPCAIMARLLVGGGYAEPGIRPLELVAPRDDVYATLLEELRKRGVELRESIREEG